MNLLTDPIFRTHIEQKTELLSLPALLENYGKMRVRQLIGLQRHQHDAFHVFMCYLAGAVLARDNHSDPIQDEEYWREKLLSLAGKAGMDAWKLVVDDASKPGFMQAPLVPADQEPTSVVTTPDKLDILQTAKNHDVKQSRASSADVDTWIYSLISLQTMSGFLGRGNQGISRMNSGFGNRPIVEVLRTHNLGRRWLDAVSRLVEHRQEVLQKPFGFNPNGMVLVWLSPWDGETQLALDNLDPFYIEICRRVRVIGERGNLSAMLYSAKNQRIAAKHLAGVVGDPWLPVDCNKGAKSGLEGYEGFKALTFPPTGITIEHLRKILLGEYQIHSLQRPLRSWQGGVWLSVSVLVRGQGTTDGFHEAQVAIPKKRVPILFGSRQQRDWLGEISKQGIMAAALMKNRVLKPAVFSCLQGAPNEIKWDHKYSTSIWESIDGHYESLWSDDYFPWLFSVEEDEDPEEALHRWVSTLLKHALDAVKKVELQSPGRMGRQYRVKTTIRSRFWSAYYREFPNMRGDKIEQSAN